LLKMIPACDLHGLALGQSGGDVSAQAGIGRRVVSGLTAFPRGGCFHA
jgi:hypothetical protein